MRIKFSLFLIFLFLVSTSPFFAQDLQPVKKDNSYWINLGIGIGSKVYSSNRTISFAASWSYQKKNRVISIRTAACAQMLRESASDFGILYGFAQKSSSHLASYGIGLGIVARGGYSDKRTFIMGIPLEFQLFSRISSSFGIGLYGFANINHKKSFYGATLCLQFGKFK